MMVKKHPFDNNYFIGYISHVSPQFVKVHFPSSTLLNKTIFSGEEFNGGLVGNFVTIEAENDGFIGKISEINLPEKERLALSEKSFQNSDFHPTATIEVLLSFDYFDGKAKHTLNAFPNIGAKVFVCPSGFIEKYVKNFGQKDSKEVPYVNLGCLTSNLDTEVCVSQQALFNRHCAIVGTTGGGKSYTIAKLIDNMVNNKSKVILLDPTGEYSVIEKGVQSVTMGEGAFFPYQKLTKEDLFFLIKPSEGVQKPKLLEAIRSLKAVKIYQENNDVATSRPFLAPFVNNGLIVKPNNSIKLYEKYMKENFSEIETTNLELDILQLGNQVLKECIYPTDFTDHKKFGKPYENNANFCYGMVSRIHNLVNTKIYNDAFNFSDEKQDEQSLTEIIKQFIAEEQQGNFILRIGFESIGYEFQAREILANAIGRYLLKLAREKHFKDNPIVLILDEAHQFLNKIVVDDFFQSTALSSFEQISKESRKFGLFLCIATQMPRDIPAGTLSQMGTFIVHRLINYNDKEAIRQSCSSANSEILSYLPVLGEGEAILTGVDFSMPLSIKISKPSVPPDSSTPMFKI
ncbi:ATP-binding protein [Listeria sp. PSOL-1]|uniref:ATP-binding protein n=1 Tax=Listeria sp. PSOL-1 TaxID=1844999 RepID=UPI001E4AA455|nr:ATP-binding protein [Listeria sp. PSOL-1]